MEIFSTMSRIWIFRLIYVILEQDQASHWLMQLEILDYT